MPDADQAGQPSTPSFQASQEAAKLVDATQSKPYGFENHEFRTGETAESRALRNLAREIRAGARAIQAAQPGTSELEAQAAALRGATSLPSFDLEAIGEADTEASEHLIWWSPETGDVVKATAYGRYGHDFDRRKGGGLPADYLERMALSNEVFGDSVSILGTYNDGAYGTPGLVIRQNYIAANADNPNPTPEQISTFLTDRGFEPVPGKTGRYINCNLGVEIDDTHTANFILAEDGTIYPVDLLVRSLRGES